MAKHIVKCPFCGKDFDANTEPFVKLNSRRYAHQTCYEKDFNSKSKEDQDYTLLVEYIKRLFDGSPSQRVWKQIKDFKEKDGYTYSGMLKTLQWWYEVKGNTIDKANGACGIIPYIYNEALQYYYAIYIAAAASEKKTVQTRVREFEIEPPQVIKIPVRLFNLEDDDE